MGSMEAEGAGRGGEKPFLWFGNGKRGGLGLIGYVNRVAMLCKPYVDVISLFLFFFLFS